MDNPLCKKPDDENSKIWRYLDFQKFVSLLDQKKCFLYKLINFQLDLKVIGQKLIVNWTNILKI